MNTQAASAVTWSMTSQGAKPHGPTKPCKECGRAFVPTFHTNKYCSDDCRKAVRERQGYSYSCEKCGNVFLSFKKQGARFCSRACKHAAKSYAEGKSCVVCGKVFVPKHNVRKTCSQACMQSLRADVSGRTVYQHDIKKTVEVLEMVPENRCKLTKFLRHISEDQFDKVWVSALVYHFCDGRKGELCEVLRTVRDRYRSMSGTEAPQAVDSQLDRAAILNPETSRIGTANAAP